MINSYFSNWILTFYWQVREWMEVGEGSAKWWIFGGDGQVGNSSVNDFKWPFLWSIHTDIDVFLATLTVYFFWPSLNQVPRYKVSSILHTPDSPHGRKCWQVNTKQNIVNFKQNVVFNLSSFFCRKPVGTWFGPNTVAQVLRKLCLYDPR